MNNIKTYKLDVTLETINIQGLPVYREVQKRISDRYRKAHKKIREDISFSLKFRAKPSRKEIWSAINKKSIELIGIRPYKHFSGECVTAAVFYKGDYINDWLHGEVESYEWA